MERAPGMQQLPPAPIFGVAGGVAENSKYLNLDEIFVDCFMDGESDPLAAGLASSAGAGGGGSGASSGINDASGVGLGPPGLGLNNPALGLAQFGQPLMPGMTMQQMLHAPMGHGLGLGAPGMPGVPPQMAPGLSPLGLPPGLQGFMPMAGNPPPRHLLMPAGAGRAAIAAPAAAADGDDDSAKGRRTKRPRTGTVGAPGLVGAPASASSAPTSGRNMSEQQKLDRRERNREHAKRSRVRKKFLLESLQKSVTALQDENEKLRAAIRDNLSEDAAKDLLAKAETSSLLAASPGEATKVLDDPDYSLVKALQTAQQNFVITDPTLPDNPIVFASQGFLDLTGYTLDQVLGRNCRFLQGPDTDPKAVEKIRKAIEKGIDMSVCLLNYRVDGSTFWNQFFIAALRDTESKIINYVGVQCKVSAEFVRAVQRQEETEGTSHNEEEEDGSDDGEDI